jgi:hypothetical protein
LLGVEDGEDLTPCYIYSRHVQKIQNKSSIINCGGSISAAITVTFSELKIFLFLQETVVGKYPEL